MTIKKANFMPISNPLRKLKNIPTKKFIQRKKTFVRVFENMRDAKIFDFVTSHRYQTGPNTSISEKKTLCQKNERKTIQGRIFYSLHLFTNLFDPE
jgi:hypothetical protein